MANHIVSKLLRWSDEDDGIYQSFGPSTASRLVAQVWRDSASISSALFKKLADRLSYDSAELPINSIIEEAETAGTKFPPVATKGSIVLLWARYSGSSSPTSYNPEGGSDVKGQEQLLEILLPMSAVITIGHDNASGKGCHSQEYHLGEKFFKKDGIKDNGRGEQLSFFLPLLERYPGRLYQIGQKTGAMDAAVLVGIPTGYIEDVDSPAKGRMKYWTNKVPFFRRAQIKEPPSVLGKSMRSLDWEIKGLQDNKVQNLPTFRLKDTNTPMPRDQWRRIAMLYQGLIELSWDTEGQESGPKKIISITKKSFDAQPETLSELDENIKALTSTQLEALEKTKVRGTLRRISTPLKLSLVLLLRIIVSLDRLSATRKGSMCLGHECSLP